MTNTTAPKTSKQGGPVSKQFASKENGSHYLFADEGSTKAAHLVNLLSRTSILGGLARRVIECSDSACTQSLYLAITAGSRGSAPCAARSKRRAGNNSAIMVAGARPLMRGSAFYGEANSM